MEYNQNTSNLNVILLRLPYIDRTDAGNQFGQRSLLVDLDHDQTVRRNASVLCARHGCKQQCPKWLSEPDDEPQSARGMSEQSSATREILVDEGTDLGVDEK